MRAASGKSGTPLMLIMALAAALGLRRYQVGCRIEKFPGGNVKLGPSVFKKHLRHKLCAVDGEQANKTGTE